ncbi:MAG: flagellar hook-length control protein FliK [Lachnospiraceae bacterium]|nr:flagellar hook-length control protein FliK [Lachnospiraceae bacterium]
MNLGNIFNKRDTKSVRAGESVRSADSVSKGERLMRLQNEVRSLKPGQTLQGTVVGRNGNSVQIELAQDFTINAKVDKSVSLALGQMMSFEVKANSSSFMSLAPLYTNTANTATILRALAAAGLPETTENMEMVAKMMEEGMPIDKESILNMSRQLLEFPGQDPTSIIQMTRLELPVTAENIEQFEQYKNATHQILSSVDTITEELPQVFQQLVQEGQADKALAFYEAVLAAFSEDSGAEDGTVTLQGNTADMLQAGETAANEAELGGNPESVAENSQGQNGEVPVAAEQTPLPETAGQENKITGDLATTLEEMMPDEETGRESTLTQGQWERLGDALRELGLHEQTAAQIKNGELDSKEILQLVRQFVQKAGQSDASDQALHKFLGGREFQELLKQEIGRQWTIEPKDVADKKQVEQLYERIREQTARLSQALDTAGKSDAPAARSVQNLQNNVDFMNQMNHLYTYVQLPLKMLGNNAHGDLYVYTNKKNLAAKDGQVSALLHLDMEHLGPLDVYVTMKDKQVSTNFTVMDDSILDLIEKHIHILNKRLEDRGYSLKAQMHVKEENAEEEETSVMQTLLHQQKNISVLSRTSFDMRA